MLLLHNRGKDYVWSPEDSLGHLLVHLYPSKNRIIRDSDPSGMRVWVILPGKEPRASEALAESKKYGMSS